jgi:hypothetical protein
LDRVKAELEALKTQGVESLGGHHAEVEREATARRNAERQADEFREAWRIATVEAGRLSTELDEANRQNALLRLDAHLRKTLEPAEAELVRRTGKTLERFVHLRDDQLTKVSLMVLRTLHDIVVRNTVAPTPQEPGPDRSGD